MASDLPVEQWKVLLVEDIYDDVRVISKILNHYHVDVQVAKNGKECLDILPAYAPTVVVMDLSMPEMDGWETLRAIRDDLHQAKLPIVAITAYHSYDLAEDVYSAGFDAFIPKPIDPETLMATLTSVMKSVS